ncbi:MAG TPA: metal ABC transporter permease [Acidiferrobacterales bacterium]|nr:metal ABC transporter permease [Acidiferrobacterales bacterium]
MMDLLFILLPALALTILMIVTHTYLGLHVLARGIIFVDLALAQVAALGVSIAFLFGKDAHGVEAQLYAVAATLLAALGFAWLRKLANKTTREVAIGCVYVVSTALSIVILSQSAQGMEELKEMLNGNILWVRWRELGLMAMIYAVLIILHAVFRDRFHHLSFDAKPQAASFLWEFLFFASFAIVITLSFNLAGILLVFAYLIIPAFSASLLVHSLRTQLLIGIGLAFIGSLAGLWLSFRWDLPTGATLVSVLGLLPFCALAMKPFLPRKVKA